MFEFVAQHPWIILALLGAEALSTLTMAFYHSRRELPFTYYTGGYLFDRNRPVWHKLLFFTGYFLCLFAIFVIVFMLRAFGGF